MAERNVLLYYGDLLNRYGFNEDHPFSTDRQEAFLREARSKELLEKVTRSEPQRGNIEQVRGFHNEEYIRFVAERSERGVGFLDLGDTPAVYGIYEGALAVVGTTVDAIDAVMQRTNRAAFVPIAGLHHAAPDKAGGFCVFNDCGVVIKHLQNRYDLKRIAYIDIDAHHGDGVYYAFEKDPSVIIADIHEDGNYIFPGTGFSHETGKGKARGTKLNIPMASGADDDDFLEAWERVEKFIEQYEPQIILFQTGADALKEDPLTHLAYSKYCYRRAAGSLLRTADKYAQGRLLAVGGGGYHQQGIGAVWTEVLTSLLEA